MLTGFYNTRVYEILISRQVPLSAREVWNIFKSRYFREMNTLKGKTKRSTIDSTLSKCAKNSILRRSLSDGGTFKYYIPCSNQLIRRSRPHELLKIEDGDHGYLNELLKIEDGSEGEITHLKLEDLSEDGSEGEITHLKLEDGSEGEITDLKIDEISTVISLMIFSRIARISH